MTLPHAFEVLPAEDTCGTTHADSISLTYDERHRRRRRYRCSGGTEFLLDLPRAVVLRAGDAVRLEDGRLIRIEAAAEALLEVRAPDPNALVRFAWHIGNRHLPAELGAKRILIREDAVIAAMLRGLGATVASVLAPFTPESGAYDARGGIHSHAHQHSHGEEQTGETEAVVRT